MSELTESYNQSGAYIYLNNLCTTTFNCKINVYTTCQLIRVCVHTVHVSPEMTLDVERDALGFLWFWPAV